MSAISFSDISNELILHPYREGVKVVKPDIANNQWSQSIGSFLTLPFCVYFLNVNSRSLALNEETALSYGFDSIKQATHTDLFKVLKKPIAKAIIDIDQHVMKNHQKIILERNIIRKDDIMTHYLSLKLPWYNQDNKIIGVFGFSIMLEIHKISIFLNKLMELGFLSPSPLSNHYLPGKLIENAYLTKREMEILNYAARGMTAKNIGKNLFISMRTVESHLENIKAKMNVSSKAELIEYFKK